MTGQALFYMGEKNLKHKMLAIVGGGGREPRLLCVEAVAVGRRAEHRLDRQRPGERQADDARIQGRRPGDDLPHHDRHGDGRGAAEPLHGADGERGPRADAGHPSDAARIADAWTDAGRGRSASRMLKLHRNAQRLLRPRRRGQQPYARELSFPDSHDAHAARSHEVPGAHRRPSRCCTSTSGRMKTRRTRGKPLEYIEATGDDVELAKRAVRMKCWAARSTRCPRRRERLLLCRCDGPGRVRAAEDRARGVPLLAARRAGLHTSGATRN